LSFSFTYQNKTIETDTCRNADFHVGKTTLIEHRGHGKRGVHRRKESHRLCIGEGGSETLSGIETASDAGSVLTGGTQ